jgi:hypothetical protein
LDSSAAETWENNWITYVLNVPETAHAKIAVNHLVWIIGKRRV